MTPNDPSSDPMNRILAALGRFYQSALPEVVRFNARVSAWAAQASWKRIFLLGFVILVAGSIIESIWDDHGDLRTPKHPVTIDVQDAPDGGITLKPLIDGKPGEAVHIGPIKPDSDDSDDDSKKSSGQAKADAEGVRIDAGGKHLIIDGNGISVEKDANAPGGAIPTPPTPPGPGDAPSHPDGQADAQRQAEVARAQAEAAKAQAEAVKAQAQRERDEVKQAVADAKDDLQDSINEAIAQSSRESGGRRAGAALWDFFKVLLTLSFAYLIAIKISSTTKRRADAMVRSAAEVAEHESLRRQVVEARLQTMQAQVEPHFLFNTLASVDYLIETDPARASMMQKNLIQYLRAALPQMRESATYLGREIDLVRAYLEILKVRMEERLHVVIEVPEGLRSAEFPPMMMQSLVENAIKHGLEPKADGGEIRIHAEIVDGELCVSVADTGLGFDPKGAPTAGTGLGLTNIRERLALLYGTRARFSIEPNQPSGTKVTLVVPYQSVRRPAAPPNPEQK